MSDVAQACADLAAWHPAVQALITQPDNQPTLGRSKPGSRLPGNQAAFNAWTDIHAGSRGLEQDLGYAVTGRLRTRGGSDANTLKALRAIAALAEAVDEQSARLAAMQVDRWLTAVLQLPAVDLEEAPQKRRTDCPFCQRPMLRIFPRSGRVGCLGCGARGVMVPGTLSDGYVAWESETA